MNKPRAHAKLKTLTEAQQAAIAEFARTHTLIQTVQWLQTSGLSASKSTVSEFLRWYRQGQSIERSQKLLRAQVLETIAQDRRPDEDKLARLGNTLFAISAIENQDPQTWYLSQQLSLGRDQLQLKSARALLKLNQTVLGHKTAIAIGDLPPSKETVLQPDVVPMPVAPGNGQ